MLMARTTFYGITAVDLTRRSVTMDFALKIRWAALDGEEDGWAPDLVLLNAVDQPITVDRVAGATDTFEHGSHRFDRRLYLRFHVETLQDLDLTRFPFDEQTFAISVRIPRHRTQRISGVECAPVPIEFEKGFRNHTSCHITRCDASVVEQGAPGDSNRKPTLIVAVALRRESFYWATNVGLPLCTMVTIAFDVFLMGPEQHVERVALIVTVMLTVVTFKTTVEDRLPVLMYATLLDRWIVFLFMLLFGMAFETATVFALVHNEARAAEVCVTSDSSGDSRAAAAALARRIDVATAVVLGVLFVTVTGMIVLRPAAMTGVLRKETICAGAVEKCGVREVLF